MKQIRNLSAYKEADCILGFVGYGSEVDTLPFLKCAVLEGKKVYCPVSEADGTMEFYRFTSEKELCAGYKGILEPPRSEEKFQAAEEKEKVFMLMPGVAFDRKKHRIGYGKGFYDRFLADYTPGYTAAVCFSCQIVQEIPAKSHDKLPDMVITEKYVIY